MLFGLSFPPGVGYSSFMDKDSDEIIADQRSRLPSETDMCVIGASLPPSYDEVVRGRITKYLDPKEDSDWDKLEVKSMQAYDDCLSLEDDHKLRKSTADTVMEIRGYKGNKSHIGDGGSSFVLSAEATDKLLSGLLSMSSEPKDVTSEEFKLSPEHNSE